MRVDLTFNEKGTVADLHYKGLHVARFGVRGPFKRNADSVLEGYENTFNGELCGIADYQYIDDKGETQMITGR